MNASRTVQERVEYGRLLREITSLWSSIKPKAYSLIIKLEGLGDESIPVKVRMEHAKSIAREILDLLIEADKLHRIVCYDLINKLAECMSKETFYTVRDACLDYEAIKQAVEPIMRAITAGYISAVDAIRYLLAFREVVREALKLFSRIVPGVLSCLQEGSGSASRG